MLPPSEDSTSVYDGSSMESANFVAGHKPRKAELGVVNLISRVII